jgi:protein SCO1
VSAGISRAWRSAAVLAALLAILPGAALAHGSDAMTERDMLPRVGPAPDFALTAQDGATFSLAALRGRVVALNFVFTRCTDVCPTATDKMVGIQEELGAAFGRDVAFVSVSVDPEHDTPQVLAEYGRAFGCDLSGWTFLTGPAAAIVEVARSYGVYSGRRRDGAIEHVMLTSLIDRAGNLRVQYLGERFDPDELLADLRALVAEGGPR